MRYVYEHMQYMCEMFYVDTLLMDLHNSNMRDKRAKFVELANKRVTKCIRDLKLIGNLSNRSAYEFTDEDAKKIVKALQREVDSVRARFADLGGASNLDFSL